MKLFLLYFIKDEKYFFFKILRVLVFFGKNGNELVCDFNIFFRVGNGILKIFLCN